MRDPKQTKPALSAWRVPVAHDHIPETGQHFDLAADKNVRDAVRQIAGLRDLLRLEAKFDVTRHGAGGLRVAGQVSATVGQNCVVTLDLLANEVEEEIDIVFVPSRAEERSAATGEDSEDAPAKKSRSGNSAFAPEPMIDGTIDLGVLATEFLILGLDPYPRKPGAVFEPPQDVKPEDGPFAALARLTKDGNGR